MFCEEMEASYFFCVTFTFLKINLGIRTLGGMWIWVGGQLGRWGGAGEEETVIGIYYVKTIYIQFLKK